MQYHAFKINKTILLIYIYIKRIIYKNKLSNTIKIIIKIKEVTRTNK